MKAPNIDKRKIWRLVSGKLKSIDRRHIFAVICILIEEIREELKNGKEIEVKNFGTFRLKQQKPRKIRKVSNGKIGFGKSVNILRFRLAHNLVRYLKGK